jgi:hypothetical protein
VFRKNLHRNALHFPYPKIIRIICLIQSLLYKGNTNVCVVRRPEHRSLATMRRIVAILVYCGLICCRVYADLRCSTAGPSDLKFSVKSRRNQTGHWTAQVSNQDKNAASFPCSHIFTASLLQVQLEHGAGHKETGPWEVDIDHITATCEDTESILIVATVTGRGCEPVNFSYVA